MNSFYLRAVQDAAAESFLLAKRARKPSNKLRHKKMGEAWVKLAQAMGNAAETPQRSPNDDGKNSGAS